MLLAGTCGVAFENIEPATKDPPSEISYPRRDRASSRGPRQESRSRWRALLILLIRPADGLPFVSRCSGNLRLLRSFHAYVTLLGNRIAFFPDAPTNARCTGVLALFPSNVAERAIHKSRDGPPGLSSLSSPVTFSTSHRTRRFESRPIREEDTDHVEHRRRACGFRNGWHVPCREWQGGNVRVGENRLPACRLNKP